MGQHIRKRRLDVALLQRELAQNLGTDNQTIRNWEADRTKPTRRYLPQLLEFLGYDPFPEPANLGERIKQYRRAHGLSQRQLAQRIGVDPSTITDWERDNHKPTLRSLDRLRLVLDGELGHPTLGGISSQPRVR